MRAANGSGGSDKSHNETKKKQGGSYKKKRGKNKIDAALTIAATPAPEPTFEQQLEALNTIAGVDNMKVIAGADGINIIEAYSGPTPVSSLSYAGDTLYSWNFLISGDSSHPTVIDASAAPGDVYIIGTSGNDTIIGSTLEGNADSIIGGEGDDVIHFSSKDRLAAADIFGGEGVNTLVVGDVNGTTAQTIADADLANTTDIDVLRVGDGANHVVLGENAALAGIDSLIGGTGADTCDATSFTNSIYIKAGGGADSLLGGAANDTFGFSSEAAFAAAVVLGGEGDDIVSLSDMGNASATIADSAFANMGSIEMLVGGANDNTITLGATADRAGISTLTGGAGVNIFNTTATTKNLTFVMDSANVTSASILAAAASTNKVTFASVTSAVTLNDSLFANFTGVKAILGSTTGANAFTFGANASRAGLQSVTGGASDDSFTVAGFTTSLIMNGGSGNDTFSFGSQANFTTAISNTSAVEIVGGFGTNTISFSNAVGAISLTDDQFASMSNIQSLVLGNGSNEITLGTKAVAAGIDSLTGGTGTDVLNAAAFTGGITIQGWSSVSGAGANQSNDTLTGGAGTAGVDVFVLGDYASNAYASGLTTNEAWIQNFDSNDIIVLAGISGEAGSISFSGDVGQITFGADMTPAYTVIASNAGTSAVLRNQSGENVARFELAEMDLRTLGNSNFQFMA